MSRTTLAACAITIAFVVPVGWHAPEADIQSDGPKLRPAQKSLIIGDATVTVDFDRSLIMAGNTVSGIFVASSDRPHDVTVEINVLEDMGYGGERVPNPPVHISDRKLKLHARPGGGTPVVESFKLGHRKDTKGFTSWFDISVSPTGVPTIGRARDPGDGSMALASVVTWGGNTFPISIEPPAQIPSEGPFTIAVRVKNTTAKPFTYLEIQVGHEMSLMGLESTVSLSDKSDDYTLSSVESTSVTEDDAVAVGAEKLFIYTVTPARPGIKEFSFIASARADGGGAMEARTFERSEAPATDDDVPSPIASR